MKDRIALVVCGILIWGLVLFMMFSFRSGGQTTESAKGRPDRAGMLRRDTRTTVPLPGVWNMSVEFVREKRPDFRLAYRDVVAWLNPTRTAICIRGRVTGPDGQPAAGTTVTVIRPERRSLGCCPPPPPEPEETLAEVFTDNAGHYEISLPPFDSSLLLKMRFPGKVAVRRTGALMEARPDLPSPDGILKVDAVLQPVAPISGQVTLSDGSPAPSVFISAVRGREDREMDPGFHAISDTETTNTDEGGRFFLERQIGGPVLITATTTDGIALRVLVEAPDNAVRLGVPSRGGSIRGRAVRLPDRTPMADLEVTLYQSVQSTRTVLRERSRSTKTGEDGHYTFYALAPGEYTLAFRTPDGLYSPGDRQSSATLSEGQEAQLPDHELFSGHELRGRVVEMGTTRPIEGALIRVNGTAVRTNGAGEYSVKGIRPGGGRTWVDVEASSPGFVAPDRKKKVSESVRIPSDCFVMDYDFELQREGLIRGTVRNRDGRPVPGARVALEPDYTVGGVPSLTVQYVEGTPSEVEVDAEGCFELVAPPGATVRVRGTAPGYGWTVSEPVMVVAGEGRRIELTMNSGSAFTGRVVTPEGEGAGGCRVTVEVSVPIADLARHSRSQTFTTETAVNGSFSFSDLPTTGPMSVWAEKPGYAASSSRILRSRTGQTTSEVTLSLRRSASLSGTVLSTDGFPERDVSVNAVEFLGAGPRHTVRSDDRGEFRLDGLPEGTTCSVTAGSSWSGPILKFMPGGPPVEVRLQGPSDSRPGWRRPIR